MLQATLPQPRRRESVNRLDRIRSPPRNKHSKSISRRAWFITTRTTFSNAINITSRIPSPRIYSTVLRHVRGLPNLRFRYLSIRPRLPIVHNPRNFKRRHVSSTQQNNSYRNALHFTFRRKHNHFRKPRLLRSHNNQLSRSLTHNNRDNSSH